MAGLYFILVLLIQVLVNHAESNNTTEARDVLKNIAGVNDEEHKHASSNRDWMDIFLGSHNNLFPSSSSAALMAQITSAERSPEEQISDIKEVAKKISNTVEREMVDLLTYALKDLHPIDKSDGKDSKVIKKRSVDNPFDSAQLVMRLLKHIKTNNEHQNIAIEKMMSAQEIAKKYNIPFDPDEGILSDLVSASEDQANELTSILDSIDGKFKSPSSDSDASCTKNLESTISVDNHTFDKSSQYLYGISHPVRSENIIDVTIPILEVSERPASVCMNDFHSHQKQIETQIPKPQTSAFSKKPSFYDALSYQPQEMYPYCSVEPQTFFVPAEDEVSEQNPTGEEYEETVTSRVIVDHEEPGAATVNHVMTYTVSEKEHFRAPKIDSIPQQMQYSFFLV